MNGTRAHRDMRYRPDTGFEARCYYCEQWWPITLDFWKPRGGLRRCKACWALYHRRHMAGYRTDELMAEAKRQAERERYAANRQKYNDSARRWRETHKEHIAAYNREYRARHPEKIRAQSQRYYAEARDVILVKKRDRYAGRNAA